MGEPDNIAVKTWKISVKAYNSQVFTDATLKKKYQDTVYGYGYVIFRGTEKECGDYETVLFKSGAKILGSVEYQPDDVAADLKKAIRALADRANKRFRDLVDANDERHPEIGWYGRIGNGARNYTPEELKAKAIADRIWSYYIKKFVSPYL